MTNEEKELVEMMEKKVLETLGIPQEYFSKHPNAKTFGETMLSVVKSKYDLVPKAPEKTFADEVGEERFFRY